MLLRVAVVPGALLALVLLVACDAKRTHCDELTEEGKIECLEQMVTQLQGALEPRAPMRFEYWPGNDVCVACRFFLGLLICSAECLMLVLMGTWFKFYYRRRGAKNTKYTPLPAIVVSSAASEMARTPRRRRLGFSVGQAIGILLAVLGGFYWFIVFATFWNFISYMMLSGLLLTLPAILMQRGHNEPLLPRRAMLACWLVGALTFALFPNVPMMPEQIHRRLHSSQAVLTPLHPLVVELREMYYSRVPLEEFNAMPFHDRMQSVDDFIKDTIHWKDDYATYRLIGLLLSPEQVIASREGDCQGQAVTTASMLLSMGIRSAVAETPFHWWAYAWDNVTGEEHFFNVHGSAGELGSVTPQPIDMVFTWFPPACDDCPDFVKWNQETTLHLESPWRAFGIAWTGAHIFVRDIMPGFDHGGQWKLVVGGVFIGLVCAVYASYFHADLALNRRVWQRFVAASCMSEFVMLGMYTVAKGYYPATFMHLFITISCTLTYTCSLGFNRALRTPSAV